MNVLLLLLALSASERMLGEWPKNEQTIDVDLTGSVADALTQITKKAGWSLVVSTPALDQKIAIRSAKRPLYEVLTLVLEAGDLSARLQGQTLFVKAASARTEDEEEEVNEAREEARQAREEARERMRELREAERERREEERERRREERERQFDDPDVPPLPPLPALPDLPPVPGVVRDKESVTAVGQNLTIMKEEVVDDAVVSGGDLIVYGRIRGDAVSMGGDVVLKESAVVEGDATAIGGKVQIEKGAILKGDKNDMGRPFGGIIKRFAKSATKSREHRMHTEHDEDDHESDWGWLSFFAKLFGAIAAFVIGVIVMAFAPERIRRVKDILREKPIQSTAAGFATLLGFVPFCVLLAVTLVGIALVPLAFVALLCAYIVAYIALGLWIGERVWPPKLLEKRTPLAAMSAGILVLTLVALLPWIGTFIVFIVTTIATGAVLISRVGSPPVRSDV